MKVINRQAFVMHSAKQMYELVNDIENYPKFLPGCSKATIQAQGDTWVRACLELKMGGIKYAFVTRNTKSEYRIDMKLEEGFFSSLTGYWQFTPVKENSCKIDFHMAFSIGNPLLNMTAGPLFKKVADKMVDAFCARADEISGEKS